MAKLTESGLVVDRLPDVLAKIRALAVQNFADITPVGGKLDLDSSSILGRIFSIIADPIRLQEEAIQAIYSAKDINQATGQHLDDLCFLSGVLRQGASKASALMMMSGNTGITIPVNSIVSSKITGDNFLTYSALVLSNSSCNAIEATITPALQYTIDWVVDSSVVTNTTITVNALLTESAAIVGARIVAAITSATDNLEARLNADNSVYIGITNKNDTGTFTVSNVAIVRVHKPVDAICQVNGVRAQDRNTINVIQTAVLGWLSAYNPFDAETGREKMSDAELRYHHFITKMSPSTSQASAMHSALKKIVGVKYVNIAQNIFDTPVNGITAHTFAPVVLGGDSTRIGQAILDTAPLGVASFGDVSVTAYDINSNPVVVKFSRPDLVPIKIVLTLETYPDFQENSPNLIRQALIDYIATLSVGDDILYSRLFTPINTVGGFSVAAMKIGRASGVLATDNIVLSHKEIATISAADITFGTA